MEDVAVGVPDGFPGDAVLGTDLGKAVARFDGVGIGTAAGVSCTCGDVEDQIALTEFRIETFVFCPREQLFVSSSGAEPLM